MAGIVFVGGTPRGRRVFELLLERKADVVAAYVMKEDDHEVHRESILIRELAATRGIPVEVTKKLTAEHEAAMVALQPDLILVVGWRTIISRTIYQLPLHGCVGVHDSPLPRYRGFAPVNWAVINGETHWGVTLMDIGEGVDEGDIVAQELFEVDKRATAAELYEQVTGATIRVIEQSLDHLLDGTAHRRSQDPSLATYACARTPEDGRIDWTCATEDIDRLIRGLCHPYPGAWSSWKGRRITIWEAEPVDRAPVYEGRIAGRVVGFDDETADVLTGDGVLRVRWLQLEGDEARPAGEVLRSVKTSLA